MKNPRGWGGSIHAQNENSPLVLGFLTPLPVEGHPGNVLWEGNGKQIRNKFEIEEGKRWDKDISSPSVPTDGVAGGGAMWFINS